MQRSHNTTLPKVTYDQQAKFGAKGKNKFWYGFKKHVSVDIQSGLINKVALTCQHYRCQWLKTCCAKHWAAVYGWYHVGDILCHLI